LSAGGNISVADYGNIIFLHPDDRKNYVYPDDGLLQVSSVVQDSDLQNPQHLDAQSMPTRRSACSSSKTDQPRAPRVNGLQAFTRACETHGIAHTAIDFAVLRYESPSKFSDGGDLGSVALDRGGRIVGILTGG
ncbi:hypothetical protein B0H15DRAFT_740246, partial [Mycena belliarum]